MSIKKQKRAAKELLHAAHKIYHYRRDVAAKKDLDELNDIVDELDKFCRDKETKSEQITSAMDQVDALLRKIGGKMYPKTFWNDNLEVALVAAIIVIGIRTFFFQPFIIPTNSMYPTYSGMNAVIYEDKEEAPSALGKTFRLLTLGAKHKSLTATTSGDIKFTGYRQVKGKKWFFLPTVLAEYSFDVAGVPHSIQVPAEFNMLETIERSFPESEVVSLPDGRAKFQLNAKVAAGDDILRFDITLGDALFVDRISYHFKRPEAGDSFVFRTRNIPGIEGGPNSIVDKYYIKRIGGVGGETLEITEDGTLLVDGSPRDEVEAFGRNASKEGEYGGYVYPNNSNGAPKLLTGPGVKNTIPEGNFVALGDNSANSLDSRFWGYVPEESVIGKAVFIYYPFTKRWGMAE